MSLIKDIANAGGVFSDLPVLETERTVLRKLTLQDANDVFEYASNPEVARYVTWDHHRSIIDSMTFIRSILAQYDEGVPSPWAIVLKVSNKLIGTVGFHNWNRDNRRAEVGYTISAKFWNKGYMTEVLKEILRFGFDTMELNRIEAVCKIENKASERVMIKCRMKYEGILREHMFVKGRYHDLKMYSMLRSEFVTL